MNPTIKLKQLSIHIYPEQAACNSNVTGCADYNEAEDAILDAIEQLTKALTELRKARK